jgi:hypothetical protein
VDRHPFDPISLVFGLLFATAGTIVAFGGSLADDGAFLAPVGLIALGFAFLYQARHRRDRDLDPERLEPGSTEDTLHSSAPASDEPDSP